MNPINTVAQPEIRKAAAGKYNSYGNDWKGMFRQIQQLSIKTGVYVLRTFVFTDRVYFKLSRLSIGSTERCLPRRLHNRTATI
jgi:hypothetical protein